MIKLTGRIMPKRLFGKIRIDYGPYNGTLQSKIVEPSTEDQNVVADNGYNALGLVLVKAATLQEKTVTPSSQTQTVVPDVGVYGLSKVIVEPQGNHGLLEEITVTPTQEVQRFTPSAGYYGIDVVNVEAAPLEEVTIYPAYEKQTITPSEGYYGIGSIVVEATDDPGAGGGGEGGEEEEIKSAEDVTFGGEYTTTDVPTSITYTDKDGDAYTLPAFPEDVDVDEGYYMIAKQRNAERTHITFTLYYNGVEPWETSDYGYLTGGVSKAWTCEGSRNTTAERYSMGAEWNFSFSGGWITSVIPATIVDANFAVLDGNGEVVPMAPEKIVDTKEVISFIELDREELYTISGATLNAIGMAVQALTGGNAMTPGGMASALSNVGS